MTDLSEITAVVLAGGTGIRLRSVVSDRPKVMADINGRPFLTYLLDQLESAGTRRAVICTGYMAEFIKSHLGTTYRGIELIYSMESEPLGTGGAVRLAAEHAASDPVLVMNGDSYCGADLVEFYRRHRERGASASLLLARVPDASRFGQVRIAPNGKIIAFIEKGDAPGPGTINAGIYLLSQTFLRSIPAGNVSIERQVFPHWILQSTAGLFGHAADGGFIDIGTPESFAAAEEFFSVNDEREDEG